MRAVWSRRTIGVLPMRSTRVSATSIGGPASVIGKTGMPASTSTASSVWSTTGSPRRVQLGGDGRGLGAGAEHADPAGDVAAEVADERR